ncbi:hypothetical protein EMIT079MI2_260018 [Bacillus sp. IT-79MI2]
MFYCVCFFIVSVIGIHFLSQFAYNTYTTTIKGRLNSGFFVEYF